MRLLGRGCLVDQECAVLEGFVAGLNFFSILIHLLLHRLFLVSCSGLYLNPVSLQTLVLCLAFC